MFVGRDLEQYVETLRTDSSPAVSQRAVTLKEVEEGAISLRKVGENLAGLKGKILNERALWRTLLSCCSRCFIGFLSYRKFNIIQC